MGNYVFFLESEALLLLAFSNTKKKVTKKFEKEITEAVKAFIWNPLSASETFGRFEI